MASSASARSAHELLLIFWRVCPCLWQYFPFRCFEFIWKLVNTYAARSCNRSSWVSMGIPRHCLATGRTARNDPGGLFHLNAFTACVTRFLLTAYSLTNTLRRTSVPTGSAWTRFVPAWRHILMEHLQALSPSVMESLAREGSIIVREGSMIARKGSKAVAREGRIIARKGGKAVAWEGSIIARQGSFRMHSM